MWRSLLGAFIGKYSPPYAFHRTHATDVNQTSRLKTDAVADSIPEMALGWGSTLMQNEATFMSLDGAMLMIACGLLTVFHPALFFPYMGKNHDREDTGSVALEMAMSEHLRRPEETKNGSSSASA